MHFRLMEGLRREESKREELVCCQDGFSVELWGAFWDSTVHLLPSRGGRRYEKMQTG